MVQTVKFQNAFHVQCLMAQDVLKVMMINRESLFKSDAVSGPSGPIKPGRPSPVSSLRMDRPYLTPSIQRAKILNALKTRPYEGKLGWLKNTIL